MFVVELIWNILFKHLPVVFFFSMYQIWDFHIESNNFVFSMVSNFDSGLLFCLQVTRIQTSVSS